MAPTVNGKIIFNEIPTGYPEPGKTTIYDDSEKIDPDTVPLDGGFLLKVLYLSIDPYMRGRMREAHIPSYSTPFTLGKPLDGGVIAVVVRSEKDGVKAGDHFAGLLPHQNYIIVKDQQFMMAKVGSQLDVPWSWYLGILGATGKTAFHAWNEFAKAKSGETAYVSTGAGPVGSVVIQLAKKDGLRVIASAGSDEKVEFMKECGADVAFNYKTSDVKDVLNKEGPINVYWDNVGGYQLEAALDAAANNARFIECGMIDGYNSKETYHVKNLFHILSKGISMNGFILFRDLAPKWDAEFMKVMPEKVKRGEFKLKEDITKGLEKVGDVIRAVQKGTNNGKAIVQVAEA